MHVTSLAFRTDIALRLLEGGEVIERDGYLKVRSTHNPAFRWGNFLLLPDMPAPSSAGHWSAVFASEFPYADYVALGVDSAVPFLPDKFGEFTIEASAVLTAPDLLPPTHPNTAVTCRPVTTVAEWDQALKLTLACNPWGPEFLRRRLASKRQLTAGGHGAWLGAFLDGELLAHLGIFQAETGVARFQDVETHPEARRQGLAGTLVHAAAGYANRTLGASRLVIVADPQGDAIRLYRRLGFVEAERQLAFERA